MRPEWAHNPWKHLLQSPDYYRCHATTLMAATLHRYEIAPPNAPLNGANVVTTSSHNPTVHCRWGEPASQRGLVDRDNYAPAHLLCHRTASAVSVAKTASRTVRGFWFFGSSLLFCFPILLESHHRAPRTAGPGVSGGIPSLKSNLTVNSLRAGPNYRWI